MAKKITIKIDTTQYRRPTQRELDEAKRYVLRRSEAANALRDIAEDEILDAAMSIAQIAMRYDIDPQQFALDPSVNETMMREVSAVMDDLEDSLMAHLKDYATAPAKDEGTRYLLWGLVLALGHRNLGLRDTIHEYLWRTLRQMEALIVAAKQQNLSQAKTTLLLRSALANTQGSREFQSLMRYRHLYNAPFVNNGGKATFSDGTPNVQGVATSGLTATLNVLKGAVDKAWIEAQILEMQENGAVGYWQARGSDYPCDPCDEEVGFHELGDIEDDPYPHYNCLCIRIPIYRLEQINEMSEYGT